MPNINKIKLSGTSYDIQDANATKTVELTQAQYDALVTGGTVDSNTFYIITDGEMFNPSGKVDTSAFTEFSGAVETELSGKTDESAFTAHTGDSTIHVTTAQTAAWNAKSDFSGSYNDLTDKPTIPTVPTSNTAFTNDAGYITSNDITGKTDTTAFTAHTADTTIHVTAQDKTNWNAKSDFSGSYNDLTDKPTIPTVPTSNTAFTNDAQYATSGYVDSAVSGKANSSDVYTKSQTSGATEIATALSGKQDTLSAGTNITIVDNVISAEGGGGKAISAGTNISVTTGETADTINCTIPAYFHTNTIKGDIDIGSNDGVSSDYGRLIIGRRVQSRGNPYFQYSIGIGVQPDNSNKYCQLYGQNSVGIGRGFKIGSDSLYTNGINNAVAIGHNATSRNDGDVTLGASTTASGGSSVAIGSGATADGAEYKMNLNNQIKVTPSNQVYIYNKDNTEMICLQDQLGGGSTYTAGDGIDITNDVISVSGVSHNSLADGTKMLLRGDVTTNGQNYSNIRFDYYYGTSSNKNNITIKPLTINGESALRTAALSISVVETSAITTSVTSSSTDSQVPSAKAVNDKLGGLSLVKLTQSAYDALTTKDSNTLYVIVN